MWLHISSPLGYGKVIAHGAEVLAEPLAWVWPWSALCVWLVGAELV